jgi:hypothetical protein
VLHPVLLVTLAELGAKFGDAVALGGEEDDEVINQVRSFVDHALVGAISGLDDGLDSLLTYLLSHAIDAALEEGGGVGTFGHLLIATRDEVLEVLQESDVAYILLAPAGVGTGVAHGTVGTGLDEKGVLIAVVQNLNDVEEVA